MSILVLDINNRITDKPADFGGVVSNPKETLLCLFILCCIRQI